jgi:hypothetical protein
MKDSSDSRNPAIKSYPKGMADATTVVKTWMQRPKDPLISTSKMTSPTGYPEAAPQYGEMSEAQGCYLLL